VVKGQASTFTKRGDSYDFDARSETVRECEAALSFPFSGRDAAHLFVARGHRGRHRPSSWGAPWRRKPEDGATGISSKGDDQPVRTLASRGSSLYHQRRRKRWSAKLKTDQDCERFIKDFWERRNPDPGSPQNKFKEQYYKRVAYAKDHFHYLSAAGKDDRARIYILFGPPDRIESPVVGAPKPSSGAGGLAVKERWIYNEIEGIGENVPVEFTDPDKSGEYRLVTDPMTLFRPAA